MKLKFCQYNFEAHFLTILLRPGPRLFKFKSLKKIFNQGPYFGQIPGCRFNKFLWHFFIFCPTVTCLIYLTFHFLKMNKKLLIEIVTNTLISTVEF